MDTISIRNQLEAILHKIPKYFSQNNSRELLSLFFEYKAIVQGLPEQYSQVAFGLSTEFSNIQFDIEWAIKEAPKKDAESRFVNAREDIKDDIHEVLNHLQ